MQHKSALCCLRDVSHAATPSCQTRQATAICTHLHTSYNNPTEYVISHSSPCVISFSLTLTLLNRLMHGCRWSEQCGIKKKCDLLTDEKAPVPTPCRVIRLRKKERWWWGEKRCVRDHPHNCRQAERSDGR